MNNIEIILLVTVKCNCITWAAVELVNLHDILFTEKIALSNVDSARRVFLFDGRHRVLVVLGELITRIMHDAVGNKSQTINYKC